MKTNMHFFIISRSVLLRVNNVSDKTCRENQNTHFMFNNFYFSENRAVYEIMWKKYCTARQSTDDNTIRRMRIACWITKATDTHSEYVILIAFQRQQWWRERTSIYVCTYIACHFISPCVSRARPFHLTGIYCPSSIWRILQIVFFIMQFFFPFYLLILLPEVQILSLALCSQTFWVCIIFVGVIKVFEEPEIIFLKPPIHWTLGWIHIMICVRFVSIVLSD